MRSETIQRTVSLDVVGTAAVARFRTPSAE